MARKLNLEALTDFNKYTLALAAAGFAYALEKFVPMASTVGRWILLVLLLFFLLSAICGVVLFAIATSARHGNPDSVPDHKVNKGIQLFGTAHALLLTMALVMLGGMLVQRVLAPPPPHVPCHCCSEPK